MSCGWDSFRPAAVIRISCPSPAARRWSPRPRSPSRPASHRRVGGQPRRADLGRAPPLDALGHEIGIVRDTLQSVPVPGERRPFAARLHCPERAHSAVGLELLAVDEDQLAGRLLAAGQQRPEHDRVGTGNDRLRNIAGVLQAAVADDRHAGRSAGEGGLVDGRDLRHADARDDPSRADRARTDTDLDPVSPGVDQGLRASSGGDVAADDIDSVSFFRRATISTTARE